LAYRVRLIACGIICALAFCTMSNAAMAQNSAIIPIDNGYCVATDSLERSLPTYEQTGPPHANRWVGLFYFMWHRRRPQFGSDYDVTRYMDQHPGFRDWKAVWPGYPNNSSWYLGEPVYGYYQSTDPWVVRRQIKLIADAGIDMVFIDYTNLEVYDAELTTFLNEAAELKSEGVRVPRVALFLNTWFESKLEHVYKDFYLSGKYDDMWFRWQGKPLILSPFPTDPSKFKDPTLVPAIQQYFTFRQTGWNDPDPAKDSHRWRYADKNPQRPALGPDGKVEQMVVCKSLGGPIWNNMDVGGVSCTPGHVPTYDDRWTTKENAQGLFFQTQWDRAGLVAPPMLFVTGWNEWVASIWEHPGVVMLGKSTTSGQGYIVDEFNMDFNRDVEPMTGGYQDAYYWQFVAGVRRYKGMLAPPAPSAPVKMKIDGSFAKWRDVRPVYAHASGSPAPRNWDGAPHDTHYADSSARNQIALAQVARDSRSVSFHVRTRAPLTSSTDRNWMLLLIDSGSAAAGWHGYNLLVNRTRDGRSCSVEANVGGAWNWRKISDAPCRWVGNDLELSIPRRLLQPKANAPLRIDFKWVDNIPDNPDIMDFYTKGDVAPDARFNYRYEAM